ncbi:MAG TPA: ABC transporter substrate-binding protein [Actinomycetales bacterium]|nr:ABC transporter substrate-binding protein [Actinomycetales bacterium]
MVRKTLKGRVSLIAAVAALALTTAACGGNGGGATTTPPAGGTTSDSTEAGAPSGELTELAIVVAPLHYEPAYIAQREGIFEQHGLDVEIKRGQDPASLIAMLMSGEVQIATSSFIPLAASVIEGLPLKIIAGNGQVDPDFDNSGVMVAPDSGITEMSQLEGKTIGVTGINTGGSLPFMQRLEDSGVPIDALTQVVIPFAGMQAALEQGTVDAVFAVDQAYHQMLAAGYPSIASPTREVQTNMPVTVWIGQEPWLAENGEIIDAFVAAMAEADAIYMENDALAREVHAEINQVPVEEVTQNLVPISTEINVNPAERGLASAAHFGVIAEEITLDELLWEGVPLNTDVE